LLHSIFSFDEIRFPRAVNPSLNGIFREFE
jgi:hypothetical protein